MDVTMTYETQSLWTWWLAVYLYTSSLGAATLVLEEFLTKTGRQSVAMRMEGLLAAKA